MNSIDLFFCVVIWKLLVSALEHTDNANVSVVTYKGDYYVSTESNIMHKIDPETLEATKKVLISLILQYILIYIACSQQLQL